MSNFDFEEFKRKASETASVIADKSAEFATLVADKTKILARKARLVTEIAGEKENLKKQYQELGRLYYEKFSAAPDESMEQLVTETSCTLERIAVKKAELEALRTEEEKVEVEIEIKCDPVPDETCECSEDAESECDDSECEKDEEE